MVTARIPGHVVVRTAVGRAEREGLIVDLGVVADQVEHGETVVCGDEVHRLVGATVLVEMQVIPVEHRHELVGVAITLEVGAHRVAETPVPLAPARREVPDLISP